MELLFPIKGKCVGMPSSKQPDQTSQDLNNVRPYWDGRLVGGQRPGVDKVYTQQIGGDSKPIKWLGSISCAKPQPTASGDAYSAGDDAFATCGTMGTYGYDDLLGQTFTTTSSYYINAVGLKLYRKGSPGTVIVKIYATDGDGKPTGDVLTSGTINGNSFTTDTDGEWYIIDLTPYLLSDATKYAITVNCPDLGVAGATNYVAWRCKTAGGYATGQHVYSDTGAAWTISDVDCMFITYSGPATVLPERRQFIAIGNNEVWYESVAGTMTELAAANGTINTDLALDAVTAFEKLFIVNDTIKKVADFGNVKITTADLNTHAPDFGNVLEGGTSGAKMIVDYITSTTADAACTIYGKRITTATFLTGETVTGTDDDGNSISFVLDADEDSGFINGGAPHWYDWTVYGGDTTYGTMPDQVEKVCLWKGRVGIFVDEDYPHQWYLPRQRNPWDWNYVSNDVQSPVAGGENPSVPGQIGDIILTPIVYNKDYLLLACVSSIWYFVGDPAENGSLLPLSEETGILGGTAWCKDKQNNVYILSTNGILKISQNLSSIENLTEETYPDFIKDLAYNPSTHKIVMGFDRIRNGIIISKTTISTGANSCWWYDLHTNGLFPESYPTACGYFSLFYYESTDPTYRGLLLGCNDGYVRMHDDSAVDDDSGASDTAIDSYVTFGPIPLGEENREGSINSLVGVTAGGLAGDSLTDSNNLTYKIWTGRAADEVVGKLIANTNPNIAGTITAPGRGRGGYKRKCARGIFAGIRVGNNTASQTWGLERLILNGLRRGRSK